MTGYVEFIGGVQDGVILAYTSYPPEIIFPLAADIGSQYYADTFDPSVYDTKVCRYKRIADTCTYVCIDWYSG